MQQHVYKSSTTSQHQYYSVCIFIFRRAASVNEQLTNLTVSLKWLLDSIFMFNIQSHTRRAGVLCLLLTHHLFGIYIRLYLLLPRSQHFNAIEVFCFDRISMAEGNQRCDWLVCGCVLSPLCCALDSFSSTLTSANWWNLYVNVTNSRTHIASNAQCRIINAHFIQNRFKSFSALVYVGTDV